MKPSACFGAARVGSVSMPQEKELRPGIEHDAADGQLRGIDEPFDAGCSKLIPPDPGEEAQDALNCDRQSLPWMEFCEVANPGPKLVADREIADYPRRGEIADPPRGSPTRDEVRRTVMSPEFADGWENGDLRKSLVGIVPDGILEALPKRRKQPAAPVYDAVGKGKLRRKHPEVGMEQYRDLQDALDHGEVLWDESPNQSPTLIVHAPRDAGRWWRYVIRSLGAKGHRLLSVYSVDERRRNAKKAKTIVIRSRDPKRCEKK